MEPHFLPTAYSIFDAAALARLLEKTHGFVDVRCQLIKGTVRDTYLVTTGDDHYIETVWGRGYVLKDPDPADGESTSEARGPVDTAAGAHAAAVA